MEQQLYNKTGYISDTAVDEAAVSYFKDEIKFAHSGKKVVVELSSKLHKNSIKTYQAVFL
ncbi:MAG: hypothetical protein APF77_03185 [Clostridia bacterium BRH_c25]|nr:MAG: hypothetical protein APF77_03185 [Clostridia bacterium BRH_c25]